MKKISPFRLLISLMFLVGLLWFVGVQEVWQVLSQISVAYIGLLVLISVVLISLSCLKWQLFIKAVGHEVPLSKLVRYYLTSYFFNMFMPSNVGGDLARTFQLGQQIQSYKKAFAATFVERLTGFLSMTLVGAAFVVWGAPVTHGLELAILSVAFVAVLGSLVIFSPGLFRWSIALARSMLGILPTNRFVRKFDSFISQVPDAVAFAQRDPILLGKAMIYSLLFHLGAGINTYACARAIGWHDVSFTGVCIIVPLVLLVSIAPVTPGAVGLQEGAFLFFLSRIGGTHAQGLGTGLVLRAKSIITALIGGIIWFSTRPKGSETVNDEGVAEHLHAETTGKEILGRAGEG